MPRLTGRLASGATVLLMVAGCATSSLSTGARRVPPVAPLARRVEPEAVRPGGPRPEILRLALEAYECGRARGYFDTRILSIIDYSLPSTERRFFVLDLDSGEVVFRELVAHGRSSGENVAVAFSNRSGSKQSSLGLFRTGDTYLGRHGYSLRLVGLEPGVNDRAEERAIVMHGAPYATEEFAAAHGRLGRSWGCPALDPIVHRAVIDRIKNGTALFAYYPDAEWLAQSAFLGCEAARPGLSMRDREGGTR
jgi:hypothetical protein